MQERLEASQVPKDIIVEVGPGHRPGVNALKLSQDVRERVENGALYLAIDPSKSNLKHVTEGAVARMTLEDFAKSDYLNGAVQTLLICNVVGDPISSLKPIHLIPLLRGVRSKLTDDGTVIIVENLTPSISEQLKYLPYDRHGLSAKVYAEKDEYENKLRELRLSKNPNVNEHPFFGKSFIVELHKKPSS